jgi:hypothetical protein
MPAGYPAHVYVAKVSWILRLYILVLGGLGSSSSLKLDLGFACLVLIQLSGHLVSSDLYCSTSAFTKLLINYTDPPEARHNNIEESHPGRAMYNLPAGSRFRPFLCGTSYRYGG